MDAEVFVFVDVNGVFVSGVAKHNVRVAHFATPLNDPSPNLPFGLVTINHRLHPFVAHRHAVRELLDRVPFGTDIKEFHNIWVLYRQVRREVTATD